MHAPSFSEPNSIIEKEGWEIRWAKPIGVSKILERQRYIREAVASSSEQKNNEIPRLKRGQGKKHCANGPAKAQDDDNVSLAQMRVLQNFVRERFDAMCDFDYIPMSNTSKYVGKVSIPTVKRLPLCFLGLVYDYLSCVFLLFVL